MKKEWFSFALCTLVCFTSCQDNDGIMEASAPSGLVNLENNSTIELIEDFRKTVNENLSKTKSLDDKLIPLSVEKKVLTIEVPKGSALTKAREEAGVVDGKTEVVLETVRFQKSDTQGFAIATTDPRINRVYAYTENGQVADTIFNKGLAATLQKIQWIVEKDIENFYKEENVVTKANDSYKNVVIGPLLQTAWSQGTPYNNMLGTCYTGGHVVAGCVTVAVAQTIAYYNYPTSYSSTYNLSTLRTQKTISPSSTYAPTVANFIKAVGLGCKINFGCEASGGSISNAQSYLQGLGFYNMTRDDDANIDLNQLYRNLQKGNVHITSGFTKNPRSGHAWIWDGISAKVNSTTISAFYSLHCNWGWGGSSDGWYADYETPNNNIGTFLDDNVQLYISMY